MGERLQEKLHNMRLHHLPQNHRTHSKNCGVSRTVSTRPATTSTCAESGLWAKARTKSR